MSELSHDAADDGFHEIQLSGKQLVFLFMLTTVTAVVIFLCGVMVGRGVKTTAAQADAAQASAQTAAPPTTTQAAPQQPAAVPAEPPATPADDELTYKKRLEGEGVAEDKLKTGAAAKPSAPAPPKPAATEAPAPAAPQPTPAPVAATAGQRPGKWVVQIVALRDRSAASSLVQRLSAKGYPAFMVNPSPNAPAPVYKVQVGRYDDRREAEQVKRRLEKEEKFSSFISR